MYRFSRLSRPLLTPRAGRMERGLSLVLSIALPVVLACESDTLRPEPSSEGREWYWELELAHHAVALSTVAPYDTLTAVAQPLNSRGDPIAGLPAPQYRSTDPAIVTVSSEGLLRAVAPAAQVVAVIASLAVDNVTHVDTVLVRVTNDPAPPVLGSISIHPIPPDTAKAGVLINASLLNLKPLVFSARMHDTNGGTLTGLPAYYRSSDRTVLAINNRTGGAYGFRPGVATVYASTTAYGVLKEDTLHYEIGLPTAAWITIRDVAPGVGTPVPTFVPTEVRLGVGAAVFFQKMASDTVDIVFDDAMVANVDSANSWTLKSLTTVTFSAICSFSLRNCGEAGNIMLPSPGNTSLAAIRVFTRPGTYEYRSLRHGTGGRIVVIDES